MSRRQFAAELDLRHVDNAFRDRFWAKVDIGSPEECWEWTSHRKPYGYGQFTVHKGAFMTASRVSLAMNIGVLTRGSVACHRCDNPPCVNPAHLFVGTQSDNAYDSVGKGRANRARGEATYSAQLTEEIVRSIRSQLPMEPGQVADLAREHGVSHHTISKVVRGKSWGWVK